MVTRQLFEIWAGQKASNCGALLTSPAHPQFMEFWRNPWGKIHLRASTTALESWLAHTSVGLLGQRVTSLNVGIDAIQAGGKELMFAKYIWAIRYAQLTGSSLFLLCL